MEPTPEAAQEAVRQLRGLETRGAGVEIRVDAFDPAGTRAYDLAALRAAAPDRPMIYTRRTRGGSASLVLDELKSAIDAGFDLVDVELDGSIPLELIAPYLRSIVLSLHDYDSVPALDETIDRMAASGARQIKIAVTPRSFDQDREIVACLARRSDIDNLSLFGMGRDGLYSRTLAPFFGSRLSFVSLDDTNPAAPGQLPFGRAAAIWTDLPQRSPRRLFAVVGNPAAHSQSPRIHNARFRLAGVDAAYGIIEAATLQSVLDPMERRSPFAPAGLSVTAPFKIDLLDEARRRGWTISDRAERVGSANTVVDRGGSFFIDNTDILGFERALEKSRKGARAAIVGAGGTARAASLAAADRGLEVVIFNRTIERAEELAELVAGVARPLEEDSSSFDVVIDTLPGAAQSLLALRLVSQGGLLVRAAYDRSETLETAARERGIEVFGAIDLLESQAEEQSRLFLETAGRIQ